KAAGANGSTIQNTVRAYPIGTRIPLRSSTEELPEMRSPGSPSVDAPRQEGRILPVEAQTILRAAQGAGGRTQRLAGTQVPGAAVGLSREKAALDWIVPEAGRERAVAPSVVMIKGARR
ncbi:hypothetical protein C6A37_11180, partial [Desulfobacteraceae bacterium SEEP-SAG9]